MPVKEKFKSKAFVPYLILFFTAFILYGNTIPNSYAIDDAFVTRNNPKVEKGVAGIPEIFASRYVDEEGSSFGYRPVATATFALENDLWGQNPHLSHFVNVLLYAVILLTLFTVLLKLFKNANVLFVLSVVVLFAAHPIHTEVVASLKNRETLLSFLFSIGSLFFFLKWIDIRRIWTLVAGILFFSIAFLSKQDAITLVAVIPLGMYFYSSEYFLISKDKWMLPEISSSSKKAIIRFVIPLVVLGIAGLLLYKLPDRWLPAENKVVYGFENPQFVNDHAYPTLPLAFYTLFFYFSKLCWPHPLGFYYGYKMFPEVGWTTFEVILSAVFHAAILIYGIWKLPKKHLLSFAALYYLFTISIFTNIYLKIPGIVGERLAFFASLGFCVAISYGVFRLLHIGIQQKEIQPPKIALLSLVLLSILIPYTAKTINRNKQWKDYLTLYAGDISYLSNSAKANSTYAEQLLKEAFNNDIKNPSPEIQRDYLNLAVKHLQRSVEIDSTYKFAWNNLGFITYMYLGKQSDGISYMEKAAQIDPGYEDAHFNLGYAYKQQGDFKKSIGHFREARRINPMKLLYYTEEAEALFESGDRARALILYDEASGIDLASDLPLISIGNIYWLAGDSVAAVENWEKAFERNPENREVCLNLWGYFNMKGDNKADYYRNKLQVLQQKNP